MENASKALLMATSVLIGVLLLSLMAYLFLFMSDYAGTVQDNLYAKEVYEFNAQFYEYEGREDLTAHDVQTIINLVKNYNSKFEGNDPQRITIIGEINIDLGTTINLESQYTCSMTYEEGKVSKIKINKNP